MRYVDDIDGLIKIATIRSVVGKVLKSVRGLRPGQSLPFTRGAPRAGSRLSTTTYRQGGGGAGGGAGPPGVPPGGGATDIPRSIVPRGSGRTISPGAPRVTPPPLPNGPARGGASRFPKWVPPLGLGIGMGAGMAGGVGLTSGLASGLASGAGSTGEGSGSFLPDSWNPHKFNLMWNRAGLDGGPLAQARLALFNPMNATKQMTGRAPAFDIKNMRHYGSQKPTGKMRRGPDGSYVMETQFTPNEDLAYLQNSGLKEFQFGRSGGNPYDTRLTRFRDMDI